MKRSYRKMVVMSVALLVLGVALAIMFYPNEGPSVLLDSIQMGAVTVHFYIDYASWDSAVLGFFVRDQAGRPRYFPMYGSTYGGLPPVTLYVYLSDTQEEMWVLSSWKGYETLGYYRIGNERRIADYGGTAAYDTPTPQSMGMGGDFPDMDPARVKEVLQISIPDA